MVDIEYYANKMGGLLKNEKNKYRRKFKIDGDYDDYWYYRKHWNNNLTRLNRFRYLDFHTYLNDDILTKVDRTSMAVSLEVRVPLLSKKIIEFCFSLPEDIIFLNSELKGFIKDAYKNIIPDRILNKSKKGFSLPNDYFPNFITQQEYILGKVFKRDYVEALSK